MTALEVLQEFVDDCEAAYGQVNTAAHIGDEWPDLASTYLHAKDVLAHEGQEEQE